MASGTVDQLQSEVRFYNNVDSGIIYIFLNFDYYPPMVVCSPFQPFINIYLHLSIDMEHVQRKFIYSARGVFLVCKMSVFTIVKQIALYLIDIQYFIIHQYLLNRHETTSLTDVIHVNRRYPLLHHDLHKPTTCVCPFQFLIRKRAYTRNTIRV